MPGKLSSSQPVNVEPRVAFLRDSAHILLVRAGQTLISTTPLVAVLDAANLALRCSACFKSATDVSDTAALLQCSLCKTTQYCSTVRDHHLTAPIPFTPLLMVHTLTLPRHRRHANAQTGARTSPSARPWSTTPMLDRTCVASVLCPTRRRERWDGWCGLRWRRGTSL